jgi:hypothetical protein
MSIEREYKEVITPISKQQIKLKAWITGREKREIQNVLFSSSAITGENLNKAKEKAIELIIVSIDGSTEKIVDTVLDLRLEDYEFLLDEIDIVSEGTIDKKKLKNSISN